MKFEFAKYTEITDLAFKLKPSYKKEGYVRFFICEDTWTYWFVRILEGYNEDYEKEEGSFILERDNIEKEYKTDRLTFSKVEEIIEYDGYENWDIQVSDNIDKLIDMLDDGFGIN